MVGPLARRRLATWHVTSEREIDFRPQELSRSEAEIRHGLTVAVLYPEGGLRDRTGCGGEGPAVAWVLAEPGQQICPFLQQRGMLPGCLCSRRGARPGNAVT